MAFMIPPTLKDQADATAGEKKLFSIFSNTLPDTCIVRYEMIIGERDFRPDFILIDPTRGILIVEVKDWGISTIANATLSQFQVKYRGGRLEMSQNPDLKCQIYLRRVRSNLVAMPKLIDNMGSLRIAVDYLVAFPNITDFEFHENSYDKIMPRNHVLLREDLNSEALFLKRYETMLPVLGAPWERDTLDSVQSALFPDTTIPTFTEHGFILSKQKVVDETKSTIKLLQLSPEQEQIAKSLGEGPRLLRGIAGTGKTLIMLYRARLLATNNKDWNTLILCWNTSLANYLRQTYERFKFSDSEGKVTIQHFSEFASSFIRGSLNVDDEGFIEKFEERVSKSSHKFDAIYIDEAQDFRKEWIGIIYRHLLKGDNKERNLLIAADDAQRIYNKRDFSWSDLGIDMRGRSKILKTVYRNSARVWAFSAFLLEEKASYVKEEGARGVQFSSKGGYDPLLIECESIDGQIKKAVEIIKNMVENGYAARNVLLLYRDNRVHNRVRLVKKIQQNLTKEDIPHSWIAGDSGAKRNFDWNEESVKISTVHSAKGMDSPIVIVLGAETFEKHSDDDNDETKLMYVALTRARELLVILYSGNEGMVPKLKYCEQQYLKYRDSFIELEQQH